MSAAVAASPRTVSRAVLPALLTAVLAYSLLQSMIVPAIPDIRRQLGVSVAAGAWLLSAFLLVSSISAVVGGRLGDLFGKRLLLLASLAALLVGSVLAALSGSYGLLVVGRGVQGLGAATFPLAYGIVRERFTADRVPVVIGIISSTFGAGFAIGLIVPGLITTVWGWPALFWLSSIITLVAFITVAAVIPESSNHAPARVDWVGAALLACGLCALLLGISQARTWAAGLVVSLLVGAVVLLAVFVRFELSQPAPLVQPRLFRIPAVAAADVVALLVGFGLYGAFSLVPQFVETRPAAGYGFGVGAIGAGLFLLPTALAMLVAGPVAGRLGARFGFATTLVAACAISVAGYAVLTLGLRSAAAIVIGTTVLGIGIGFSFTSVVNLVVSAIDPSQVGQASGVNTIVRTIGGALGAAVSAVILETLTAPGATTPTITGYRVALIVCAAALLVAMIAALTARLRDRRTHAQDPTS